MKVIIVAHDTRWKEAFRGEKESIANALGDNAVAIHHIGSTAIPDIFAKPIIDILIEVKSLKQLDEHSSKLVQLGYEAKGEFGIPGRRYFRKNDAHEIRTHQIHAFESGDPNIARHLAFRDFMIAHPAEAQVYSNLKRRLATLRPDDIEAYIAGKDAYVKEHEAKALDWVVGPK